MIIVSERMEKYKRKADKSSDGLSVLKKENSCLVWVIIFLILLIVLLLFILFADQKGASMAETKRFVPATIGDKTVEQLDKNVNTKEK